MSRWPRRRFLLYASALLSSPLVQATARPLRIAWFSAGDLARHKAYVDAFRDGLRELGYAENRDYTIEYHWRGETFKPYRWMAFDIARAEPDLIVTTCEITALAASGATDSIPIVMAASADPVAHGLVESLARSGNNLTGLSFNEMEIGPKRLDLLREIVPDLQRVGVIMLADEPVSKLELQKLDSLVRASRYELVTHRISEEDDFERAFASMRATGTEGILDYSSLSVTFPYKRRFIDLALESRIPVAFHLREMVEAGGLFSYGPVASASFRRAAYYVDRIAGGAKPGELAIEQPTQFELTVNLETARAIGVEIPPTMLLRADKVFG